MSRESTALPPYKGEVLCLARGLLISPRRWELRIAAWEGGRRRERPAASEVFDRKTLAGQLRTVGFQFIDIRWLDGYTVLGIRGPRRDPVSADVNEKLLKLLTEHYGQHKGRRITWALARR